MTLKEARKFRGLTIQQLSNLTGVEVCHISWLENGIHYPNEKTKRKFEDEFGQIDWIESYKFKPVTKREATKKLKAFTSCILGLPDVDQKAIVSKAINQLKHLV